MIAYPGDRPVGHVSHEVILRIVGRWLDWLGVLDKGWSPLVGISTVEPEEVFKPHTGRPLVEWTGLAGLVIGGVVVLTKPRCVVAVVF